MCVLTIISFAAAQENQQRSWDTLTLTPNINEKSINNINNIWLRFCNDGIENDKLTTTLDMKMQPWGRSDICTIFVNRSADVNTKIIVWFTSGTVEKDGTTTCGENWSTSVFYHLIKGDDNKSFVLSGKEQSIKKFKIVLPTTATGTIQGCLSFYLPDNYSKGTWDIFGIMVRKVAPIGITVTWAVYNLWRRDDYKELYTANKSSFLKFIIAILGIWLIVTVIQTSKKKDHDPVKEKHHSKK